MPTSIYDLEVDDVLAGARPGASHRFRGWTRRRDRLPFPSPEDWRDCWTYFVLVDRLNNPDAPPRRAWNEPFGGFHGETKAYGRASRTSSA